MRIPLVLCALAACGSPEHEAAETARAWLTVPLDAQIKAWPLVCADDQEARPLELLTLDDDEPVSLLPEGVVRVREAEEALELTVASVALDPDGAAGTVHVQARGELGTHEFEVAVERQGDRWCVSTGWAEGARARSVAAAAEEAADAVPALVEAWRLDEAQAEIERIEALLADFPEDGTTAAGARVALKLARAKLEPRLEGWLGGRWNHTVERDPMSDQARVTAVLQASGATPDRASQSGSLTLRCDRGVLDVALAPGRILREADGVVMGRYRFGDAPALPYEAQIGPGDLDLHLMAPSAWLEFLAQHDGSRLRMEVPTLREPTTVEFDLTAARKAVDAVRGACP